MGFITGNTNEFEVFLTQKGREALVKSSLGDQTIGFKDLITNFSISDHDINYNVLSNIVGGGTVDTSFNPGSGFNNTVLGLINDTISSKIYAFGNFTTYNGISSIGLVRINSDGSCDTSFVQSTGFTGTITSIAVLSDGSLIVSGGFNAYNGITIPNGICKLNADGSANSTFKTNIGTGMNTSSSKVKVSVDSLDRIVVVANLLTSFNGHSHVGIIRLNSNGTIDSSFTGNNLEIGVNNFSVTNDYDNDQIIVCGDLTSYNSQSLNGIVKINYDGSIDTTFLTNTGTGFDNGSGQIYSVKPQIGDKFVIGGEIKGFNGRVVSGIVRLNGDGTFDTTFNQGTGVSNIPGIGVSDLIVQPDNKIIIVGYLTSYNGTNSVGIVRINEDGSIDSSLNIGSGFNISPSNAFPWAIKQQNDGKLIIGGNFTNYNNTILNRIIRLNNDTLSFNPNLTFYQNIPTIKNTKSLTNGINEIFTQATIRGKLINNKNIQKGLLGSSVNTLKDYIVYQPDVNLNENLSMVDYRKLNNIKQFKINGYNGVYLKFPINTNPTKLTDLVQNYDFYPIDNFGINNFSFINAQFFDDTFTGFTGTNSKTTSTNIVNYSQIKKINDLVINEKYHTEFEFYFRFFDGQNLTFNSADLYNPNNLVVKLYFQFGTNKIPLTVTNLNQYRTTGTTAGWSSTIIKRNIVGLGGLPAMDQVQLVNISGGTDIIMYYTDKTYSLSNSPTYTFTIADHYNDYMSAPNGFNFKIKASMDLTEFLSPNYNNLCRNNKNAFIIVEYSRQSNKTIIYSDVVTTVNSANFTQT